MVDQIVDIQEVRVPTLEAAASQRRLDRPHLIRRQRSQQIRVLLEKSERAS